MHHYSGWKGIIDKFKKNLFSWKVKLLFIGGRSMLWKLVLGSLGIYYMSVFFMPVIIKKTIEEFKFQVILGEEEGERKLDWIIWDSVLANSDKGGLDIGSLDSFNKAPLYKWKWAFHTCNNSIWSSVVKFFHGRDGGFGTNSEGSGLKKGVWCKIIGTINPLYESDIIPRNAIKRKIGNGDSTDFGGILGLVTIL